MTPRLRPYAVYEASGIEHLGHVPAHWDVRRLRNICELRVSNVDKHTKVGEIPVQLCNYVDVYKNDRIRAGMAFMAATATADEIGRFRLQLGDVLITKDSETWDDIGIPALVQEVDDDVVSGYHLALLRPDAVCLHGGFLFRAIESQNVARQLHVRANGVTRYGLSHEAIKSIRFPLPPRSEQASIVRFLDHVDRRIRRYIRAKEKLIALLEEQKQAVVHEAVTGRIDVRTGRPYPEYKDSGVKWLGDIPEHWRRARLKAMLYRPTRNGLFKKKEHFGTGVPLVNVADVYSDDFYIVASSLERVKAESDEIRRFRIQSGDIFFVRSSLKLEGTGRAGIATSCSTDTVFECHLVQARPDARRVNPRYLVVQLNSHAFRHYLISRANTVTMATVAQDTISSCPVVTPGRAEQDGAVEWIDRQLRQLSRVIEDANRQIVLLREYRSRLIADVVTGKLDVREVVAGFPEMDPLATEGDPVDSIDHRAGSNVAGERHAAAGGSVAAMV